MSSIFIPQLSRGLPEDFYEKALYTAYDEAPNRLPIGSEVVDYARGMSFVLVQCSGAVAARQIVEEVITHSEDTTNVTDAKGTRGSREVTLTLAGVTKDQYKNGILRAVGALNKAYVYKIQGNTATAGGLVTFTLTDALSETIPNTENVRVRTAPKVRFGRAATASAARGVGAALIAGADEEFIFVQAAGEADVISNGTTTGGVLAKATTGRVDTAIAGQQIVAYHTDASPGTTTAGDIIPVHLVMSNAI